MLKGAAGFVYTGDFKDGLMHGEGEYRYSSGDRYVGNKPFLLAFSPVVCTNLLKLPYFFFPFFFEGEFRNDQFNGKGVYYFADGEKLVGEFKDGQHMSS